MTDSEKKSDFFELGDFPLQSGKTLKDARLAYAQFGSLNAQKDNLVLLPTYYGGSDEGMVPLIGADGPLDPERYCIIIVNMLGAGRSTSPSCAHPDQSAGNFPSVSLYDNVQAQKKLIESRFTDVSLALVMGWSMGGMQALQWACLYPEKVRRVMSICATVRCWPHNQVFLEGVKAALTCDPVWNNGFYRRAPVDGLKAFGRVYAGWAFSQAFFRDGLYRQLGFDSIESLLEFWEQDHLAQDANDLLAQLATWRHGDVSDNPIHNGNLEQALGEIRMPAVIMPSSTDLYFTTTDAAWEADQMPGARLVPLVSDWGHCAGAPGRNSTDTQCVLEACAKLMSQNA